MNLETTLSDLKSNISFEDFLKRFKVVISKQAEHLSMKLDEDKSNDHKKHIDNIKKYLELMDSIKHHDNFSDENIKIISKICGYFVEYEKYSFESVNLTIKKTSNNDYDHKNMLNYINPSYFDFIRKIKSDYIFDIINFYNISLLNYAVSLKTNSEDNDYIIEYIRELKDRINLYDSFVKKHKSFKGIILQLKSFLNISHDSSLDYPESLYNENKFDIETFSQKIKPLTEKLSTILKSIDNSDFFTLSMEKLDFYYNTLHKIFMSDMSKEKLRKIREEDNSGISACVYWFLYDSQEISRLISSLFIRLTNCFQHYSRSQQIQFLKSFHHNDSIDDRFFNFFLQYLHNFKFKSDIYSNVLDFSTNHRLYCDHISYNVLNNILKQLLALHPIIIIELFEFATSYNVPNWEKKRMGM